MIGTKGLPTGLPTGLIVGLAFAGLAYLITGMPSAAMIFGVVFGGVTYGVMRYRALYGKPATSGEGGSGDDTAWDSDTSTWSSSSMSIEPTPANTDCGDSGSDSSSDGGSCDGGGDGGGGGD